MAPNPLRGRPRTTLGSSSRSTCRLPQHAAPGGSPRATTRMSANSVTLVSYGDASSCSRFRWHAQSRIHRTVSTGRTSRASSRAFSRTSKTSSAIDRGTRELVKNASAETCRSVGSRTDADPGKYRPRAPTAAFGCGPARLAGAHGSATEPVAGTWSARARWGAGRWTWHLEDRPWRSRRPAWPGSPRG